MHSAAVGCLWWAGAGASSTSLKLLHLMSDFSLGSLLFGVPGLGSAWDMDTALMGIQMSRPRLRMAGEEKMSRRPWSTFQDLKRIYKEDGEGLLARV